MDKKIIRTEEEINTFIERSAAFATKHPRSFFGDDNVRRSEIEKRFLEHAKKGTSVYALEMMRDVLSDNENMTADSVIQWLTGEEEEDPYGGDTE